MASLNKVILIGNMTADPEVKQTQSGLAVVSFTIAVNRRVSKDAEQKTDFINIVAWRKTAEFVGQYFKKGKQILVCGSIQTRSWTDKDGQKRFATEIVADEAYYVDAKNEAASPAVQKPSADSYIPDSYSAATPSFEEMSGDEELPF